MQDYFGAKTGENQQFWHIKQTPKTHLSMNFGDPGCGGSFFFKSSG